MIRSRDSGLETPGAWAELYSADCYELKVEEMAHMAIEGQETPANEDCHSCDTECDNQLECYRCLDI